MHQKTNTSKIQHSNIELRNIHTCVIIISFTETKKVHYWHSASAYYSLFAVAVQQVPVMSGPRISIAFIQIMQRIETLSVLLQSSRGKKLAYFNIHLFQITDGKCFCDPSNGSDFILLWNFQGSAKKLTFFHCWMQIWREYEKSCFQRYTNMLLILDAFILHKSSNLYVSIQ